jgi:hypothetical protein
MLKTNDKNINHATSISPYDNEVLLKTQLVPWICKISYWKQCSSV